MISGDWDRELLLTLSSLVRADGPHPVWGMANNALLRGFAIFFPLVALWFSGDFIKRRSRMLAGLLAACLATVLSIWLQFHVVTHTRPILDPALHLTNVDNPDAAYLGPHSLVPERHGNTFFRSSHRNPLRKSIGRANLFSLGRRDYRSPPGRFRLALPKRHSWLADSRAGICRTFLHDSLPADAI